MAMQRSGPGHGTTPKHDQANPSSFPFPVDVAESADSFIIEAPLAGAEPEDVKISVDGRTLSIRANLRAVTEATDKRWVVRERRSGVFDRSVTLPEAVDAEQAEARYDHGVLIIVLPKLAVRAQRGPAAPAPPLRERPTANTSDQFQGGPDQTAGGDIVTEQSQESFPASDAPSWTPGKL